MGTTLITGANRGIGLELARRTSDRGDQVVAACRTASPELRELSVEVLEGVDVTSDEAVAKLAAAVGDREIDTLILNAGVLTVESLGDLDFDRIRHQLEVNALGPLRVVQALRARMTRGSKVAIITSRMGSLADNTSGGYYGYRMSKAAVNAAAVSLSKDLQPDGVAVVALHPGFVRTEMTGGNGDVDPAVAAERLVARIDELDLASTGRFRHANGEPLPW